MKSIRIRFYIYALLAVSFASCVEKQHPHVVQKEVINEAVYASGEILPDPYDFIQSTSYEVVSHICVRVGDYVKEGDIVAFLGASKDNEQLAILRQRLEIANAAIANNSPILNELLQKIELAKKQYDSDKRNADRYSTLAQSNAVSQKDAENYAIQAEASRTEYNRLREQYEAKINELSVVKLETKNLLAQTNTALEDKILRSRISGKVLSIQKRQGESVSPNESIMLIGSANHSRLHLIIDERDISKVELGQRVIFETNTYSDQNFHGTIDFIDPLIRNDLRCFKAEASIEGDNLFYPQSTIDANIIIREKERVILIPSDYLLPSDSVLLKCAGEIEMRKVITGIRIGNNIEITDGISEGEIILSN